AYTTYNPLRAFVGLGLAIAFVGIVPIIRFLIFYLQGAGDGHVQSLVIGGALLVLGVMVAVMGVLADLIAANRKLIETSLVRLRQIEERLPLAAEAQEPVARTRRKGAA
ncbi:MAG: glycosyltransferase family 2 protein, partial [Sphingopyxis sp.]